MNSEKELKQLPLGDRMKAYEKAPYHRAETGEYLLPENQPFLARIDGHTFSKFTKGFQKPYDPLLAEAMICTTGDLVDEFNARTGYTCSDEITLIFIPVQDPKTGEYREWPFLGRVIKLSSLMAGFASVRFNYHLNRLANQLEAPELEKYSDSDKILNKIKDCRAHFDARLFSLPNMKEVYNNIYWRLAHDCVRNSISNLARQYYSPKQLWHKNGEEMKKMIKEAKGDYDSMPMGYKYGTFLKRELYQLKAEDRRTGEAVVVLRSKIARFCQDMKGYDPKFAQLLEAKYLNEDEFQQEPKKE